MKDWYKPIVITEFNYNLRKDPVSIVRRHKVRELEANYIEAIELLAYTLDCLESDVNICTSEIYDLVEKAYKKPWKEINNDGGEK